ncbi:MAG: thiol-disulfide oxidoreductase DCC family protein [Bacteroidetes bacterium]|nr:thiol-disulfide oxidoreductase DCC family protein [Bacteroidota bacterium]
MVVLYDGVCHLCNGAVQFIIRHDKKNKFVFTSLQSEVAQKRLREIHFKNSLNTIVLLKGTTHFEKSDAVLEIVKNLSGAWPLLYALKIVPRFLRDALYSIIARNRYRWFGKSEVCIVPSQEISHLFLDS